MSGTSQASNLGGMLTNIGDTIGRMGGAGNQFVESFRARQAPAIDQNDPASMRAYADWAMRNGDQQTAQQYQLAAGKMEQEQGARKGAVDMQQMGETLKSMQARRDAQINNAGGDQKEIDRINAQWKNAEEKLVGRMDELSAQYGLESTGTGALQQERQRRDVAAQIKLDIDAEPDTRKKAQLSRLLVGVQSGAISPDEAIKATTVGTLGGGDRSVQRSVNYKDGSVQTVYRDGTTEITTASGNTYAPGDDGYEEATTGARDAGVSYAGDVAGATQGGKQAVIDRTSVAEEYMASRKTQGTYEEARDTVQEMEDYSFGKVTAQFPNFSEGSLKLENFKTQMGLDVIAGGNFGPLSEGELKLALNKGIPDGLSKKGTLKWIDDRIEAEKMVQRAAEDYMRWSSENPGKTRADYIMDRSIDTGKENEPSGADNNGASLSENSEPQGSQITLSNGAVARKVS